MGLFRKVGKTILNIGLKLDTRKVASGAYIELRDRSDTEVVTLTSNWYARNVPSSLTDVAHVRFYVAEDDTATRSILASTLNIYYSPLEISYSVEPNEPTGDSKIWEFRGRVERT